MAKDLTPDAWIASWSSNGTNITIPIASITGLTSAEADTTTGDIRAFLEKLLCTLTAAYDALSAADQPDTLTISRKSPIEDRLVYTITFHGSLSVRTFDTEA